MPLSIDRLICHRLRIPLSKSWDTAYASETFVETLFLKAYAGDVHCWIEVSPLAEPRYMPESAALTELALKEYFAPACLAKEWESSDDLHQSLQQFRGLFAAKACIDIAWHSLYKKVNGLAVLSGWLEGQSGNKT